jgi:hypothetical protein
MRKNFLFQYFILDFFLRGFVNDYVIILYNRKKIITGDTIIQNDQHNDVVMLRSSRRLIFIIKLL